jgi:dTDP-glucose 4,6-dehydratase
MKRLLVTGGRGFIGSHFVEEALKRDYTIIDVDKMTYAASEILPWDNDKNYKLIKKDIADLEHLPMCDAIVNFAAESHVDNSIKSSEVFVKSNIQGTHNLLELVRGKQKHERPLFFHISTDEVYGDKLEGLFIEEDKLSPSNPYSATKVGAEMLVFSYSRTYCIDYLLTRTSNNYGERQYREKLIPKCIDNLRNNKKIPLHGDGSYIRDWTYVKDNVCALLLLLESGIKNDVFNIAAENFMTNLEVAKQVLEWENKDESNIEFVENRWGQDLRYAVDSSKIRKLGWKPKYENGLFKWF